MWVPGEILAVAHDDADRECTRAPHVLCATMELDRASMLGVRLALMVSWQGKLFACIEK